MTVAAAVSAANPWTGSSFTTRWPIVRMIRQPPAAVPSEIAPAASTITQMGTLNTGRIPAATSAAVMIPIVFWAPLEPWLNAIYAAEISWSRRKRSLIRCGSARRNTLSSRTITRNAPARPMIGEPTRGTTTFVAIASTCTAEAPSAASVAPSSPPISAWLLELGSASRQVIRFQAIPPISAAAMTTWPWPPTGVVTMPLPMVAATSVPVRAPRKFAIAERTMANSGRSARVETEVAIAFAVS